MLLLKFLVTISVVSATTFSFTASAAATSSLRRQPTLEVYWESYLTFPNDRKSCRQRLEQKKVKRSPVNPKTVPFGFDLVSLGLPRHCNIYALLPLRKFLIPLHNSPLFILFKNFTNLELQELRLQTY